jgi:hypothetical protein
MDDAIHTEHVPVAMGIGIGIGSSPLVGGVSSCLQDDTTVHTSLAPEADEMSTEASMSVDLGVELFPNDGRSSPSNDVEVKSLSSLSQSMAKESIITYRSLDTESVEDSYMPRRKRSRKCKADDSAWEFLDDVSLEDNTLETEDVTNSVTTFGAENSSICWSVCSDDNGNGLKQMMQRSQLICGRSVCSQVILATSQSQHGSVSLSGNENCSFSDGHFTLQVPSATEIIFFT